MSKLEIWCKDVRLKKFGKAEVKNEVYILCMGIDTSLQPQNKMPDGTNLISETFKAYNKYSIVSVSPVFHNIRRGDSLSILGDGLLLYGPKDPGGKIALHGAVMESDDGTRDIGKTIEEGISHSGLFNVIDKALAMGSLAAPQVSTITAASRFAFETVTYFLKRDGDDVVSTFHYSSTYQEDRGGYATPEEGELFTYSDRYVDISLDVNSR